MSEFVLSNIINLFEILDAVKHLINLVVRFFSDLLSMNIYILVKLLKIARGELSVALNLLHQVVGKKGHLVLGLHDLLHIDDMSDIANNQKLVLASGHIHINLI